MYAKTSRINSTTFIFICVFFSILQSLQSAGNDLKPSLQGVGLVIQYVGKEKALQNASE
jgi:hypothetical protein